MTQETQGRRVTYAARILTPVGFNQERSAGAQGPEDRPEGTLKGRAKLARLSWAAVKKKKERGETMLRVAKRVSSNGQRLRLRQTLSATAPFSLWASRPGLGVSFVPGGNKKLNDKSEWWVIDGEMHEIGDSVPARERFAIPRDNLPNRRRKQMREQFMRRTRLALKEGEQEPWCKRYMELYQELRENWERLYWDEGYSKKIAQDHANYESEEDDIEFSPNRGRHFNDEQMQDHRFGSSRLGDTWNRDGQVRDKFDYDRERRMREKAFAPMHKVGIGGRGFNFNNSNPRSQPFDVSKFFPENARE